MLVLIMGCVAVITVGFSIGVLYQAAFDEERARLIELAQSKTRMIEVVDRLDALHSRKDHPEGAEKRSDPTMTERDIPWNS